MYFAAFSPPKMEILHFVGHGTAIISKILVSREKKSKISVTFMATSIRHQLLKVSCSNRTLLVCRNYRFPLLKDVSSI